MSSTLFHRTIETKIIPYLQGPEALVITGMRRVGKTTLMKRLYQKVSSPSSLWFDLENPLEISTFENPDYRQIASRLNLSPKRPIYIFIDEVQNYPPITKVIKYLIDHYHTKFILSGSASYYLKNLFPESLAGRKYVFELFPLTFPEFLTFKDQVSVLPPSKTWPTKAKLNSLLDYSPTSSLYDEYLRFGGFPEVVLANSKDEKQRKLTDIFSAYYELEIKGLADFRKLGVVRDLIQLLAQRVGNKLDMTKLSQELEVTRATLYQYLAFLQHTYFIHLVKPFSKSLDRQLAGQPKLYLCDNGIAQIISPLNQGQLFENAVFNQLKHYGQVHYYQKPRTHQEIDFILNQKIAIETKNKATPASRTQLAKLSQKLGIKQHYLISHRHTNLRQNVIYPQFV